jgi:hypothetical protein
MHLKAQRPIFVPAEYCDEIEKMSKAALMDLAWDFATRCCDGVAVGDTMDEFRRSRDIVLTHRKQAAE